MERSFWEQRWREGRIGFHQAAPHRYLERFVDRLGLEGARVLVPLAGKAIDVVYLASRAGSVTGVEIVERAITDFFREQSLPVHRTVDGPLVRFEGENVEMILADYFSLDADDVGTFDACFDRAALVALDPPTRAAYVSTTRGLLGAGARTLLVTYEHDAPPVEPPFSVDEATVRALYADDEVELLAREDVFDAKGGLAARGATQTHELAFSITRR